jgi:hypothetical protein
MKPRGTCRATRSARVLPMTVSEGPPSLLSSHIQAPKSERPGP